MSAFSIGLLRAYRAKQWADGITRENEVIHVITDSPTTGKKEFEHSWDCSHAYCRAAVMDRELRELPSGVYCNEHYMSLPPCRHDGCLEPAIDGGYCQDHMPKEEIAVEAIYQGLVRLGLIGGGASGMAVGAVC